MQLEEGRGRRREEEGEEELRNKGKFATCSISQDSVADRDRIEIPSCISGAHPRSNFATNHLVYDYHHHFSEDTVRSCSLWVAFISTDSGEQGEPSLAAAALRVEHATNGVLGVGVPQTSSEGHRSRDPVATFQ